MCKTTKNILGVSLDDCKLLAKLKSHSIKLKSNDLNVEKWKSTIQNKLKSLKTNKTQELTILPKGEFQSHPNKFLK
jgi:hypothetical protein